MFGPFFWPNHPQISLDLASVQSQHRHMSTPTYVHYSQMCTIWGPQNSGQKSKILTSFPLTTPHLHASLGLTTFAFMTDNVCLKQSNNSIARQWWSLHVLLDTYVPSQMCQSPSNSLATSLTPHLVLQMNPNTSTSTVASPCMLFVDITLRTSSTPLTKQSSTTKYHAVTLAMSEAYNDLFSVYKKTKTKKYQRNRRPAIKHQSKHS